MQNLGQSLGHYLVPGTIAVPFFLFGFFVTANLLDLSLHEIAVGLFAGVVGGLTMLVAVLHREHTEASAEPRA
jgi:hypothetical protein